jgi:hypothetical protein
LADSAQLHAVVVDLETEGRGVGDRQLIQTVVFEIVEIVAAKTNQVVVELEAGIEAGDSTGMTGLCDDTDAGEVLEGAVDRSARDAGEASFDSVEDLIGRWVVVELEDRLEDDPALHRVTLAALAAELPEELDAFCPCRLVQAATPRIPSPLAMNLDENLWH